MSKTKQHWLIAAVILTVIGTVIVGSAVMMMKGDLSLMSGTSYETNHHPVTEEFGAIRISLDTADLRLVYSSDASSSVTCYEQSNVKHAVAVKDGMLVIEVVDERKWYEHIGFFTKTPTVTLTLPETVYGMLSVSSTTGDIEIDPAFTFQSIDVALTTGDVTCKASAKEDLRIETTTGKITVSDLSAETVSLTLSTGSLKASGITCRKDLSLNVTTGKTELSDITCRNLSSDGTTGSAVLKHVIAEETLSLERSTGDIILDRVDAATLKLRTTTGDVKGSLLSEKVFFVDTTTGDRDYPHTSSGGTCEIETTTGDVRITLKTE